MKTEIARQGTYPILNVTLDPGDKFIAESGAMTWMDAGIDVVTSTRGGVFAGLKRKMLSGESFFQNEYTANKPGQLVAFAAGQPGAIGEIQMDGQDIMMERGAYLAGSPEVKIESKFQGLKGLFNEGMFVLRATGSGPMFFSSYGDLEVVNVDGEYVVDNGYAVAWDATLDYKVTKAKKIRSFLFGDQLLLRFSGNGRVWVQSRSAVSFSNWVYPFRRVRQRN